MTKWTATCEECGQTFLPQNKPDRSLIAQDCTG